MKTNFDIEEAIRTVQQLVDERNKLLMLLSDVISAHYGQHEDVNLVTHPYICYVLGYCVLSRAKAVIDEAAKRPNQQMKKD